MKIPKAFAFSAVAITAVVLAGCTGGDSKPSTAGEVGGDLSIIFDANFEASLSPVVADFEERYPDVNLEVEYAGGDIPSTTSTQLQAGTAPDIFLTYPGGSPTAGGGMNNITLGSQGLVADLSDASWAADIPETWAQDVVWNDGVWAYPGALQGLGPNYNLTKVEELGLEIPTTWDDFLTFCADAREAGVPALAAGFNDRANMIYLTISSTLVYGKDPDFNAKLFDGSETFAGSGWEETFDKVLELNDAGCFQDGALGASVSQAGELVASGGALATVDVGATLAVLNNLNPDNEYVLTAFPATNGENNIPALGGYTLSVNAEGNIATAKAFLEVLHEHAGEYSLGFSSVPVIPVEGFEPPPGLEALTAAIADGTATRLPDFNSPEMQPLMMAEVQGILLGTSTVSDSMAKFQELLDRTEPPATD